MARKPTGKKGAAAPATTTDNTATPAPAAAPQQAEAAPAKAKRPPAEVRNGVPRPRAGGLCAAVWELTEGMAKGDQLPSIAEVKAAAKEAGLNETNVSIEYYRCRQFHGVRGRQPKAEAAQAEA